MADYAAELKTGGRAFPRIPKSARIAVAGSLAKRIKAVVSDGTPEAWRGLFAFAYAVLHAPEPNNRTRNELNTKTNKKSLASQIK